MKKIIQKIDLDEKPEIVWRFMTDPKNFPQYVYGYSDGTTTAPHETGIGASFEWHGKFGPFKLKTREKIVEWLDGERVAYTGTMFGIPFDSSIHVREIGDRTRLAVSIGYKIPLYFGGAITDAFFIRRMVKKCMQKSLDRLKDLFNDGTGAFG